MTTQIIAPTASNILRCAARLKNGALVAFPTETVYALGAVAVDEKAVKRLYEVKERPLNRALIVAVSKKSAISTVAKNIPEKAQLLIDKFMPGALTLLLDRADCIPDIVTAGTDTVAVRIPDNDIALKLIDIVGKPVVVPSANTSQKPSPTLASHVKDDLDGKIEFILDGGASDIGIESTIVDARTEPPTVVRIGGVSTEQLQSVVGQLQFKREEASLETKYTPQAEVLFSAFYSGMSGTICNKYDALASEGRSVVIVCLDGNVKEYGDRKVYPAGKDYADYAHNLFALFRKADADGFDTIIAEGVKAEGIGASLIGRLIKASKGQII